MSRLDSHIYLIYKVFNSLTSQSPRLQQIDPELLVFAQLINRADLYKGSIDAANAANGTRPETDDDNAKRT